MNIEYEPNQIPGAVHEISFSDEPTLSHGLYLQQAGRFKRHGKVCVTSTPSGKGKNWINDVMGEMGNVNEFISIPSGEKWVDKGADPLRDYLGTVHQQMFDQWLMDYFCQEINRHYHAAKNYQLPKSTISDHLKDCFGWITC